LAWPLVGAGHRPVLALDAGRLDLDLRLSRRVQLPFVVREIYRAEQSRHRFWIASARFVAA
jgi:hypothetical protein